MTATGRPELAALAVASALYVSGFVDRDTSLVAPSVAVLPHAVQRGAAWAVRKLRPRAEAHAMLTFSWAFAILLRTNLYRRGAY